MGFLAYAELLFTVVYCLGLYLWKTRFKTKKLCVAGEEFLNLYSVEINLKTKKTPKFS